MMNNIQLIQEDYSEGDAIRISCSLGTKEGYILAFLEDRIKLRPYEDGRKPFSIQNSTITDWEEGMPQQDEQNEIQDNNIGNGDILSTAIDENFSDKDLQPISESTKEELSNIQNLDDNNVLREDATEDDVKDQITPSGKIQLKPVGFIPPEELMQIDPKLKKKKKMVNIGKDFSSLASLASEIDLANREKYVSANGEIVSISSTYGFVYDSKLRKKIFFSISQIIDPEIKPFQAHEMPVVFHVEEGDKGPRAVCIHKPSKIGRLFKLSEEHLNNGKRMAAIGVLNNILNAFPSNEEAQRRKEAISIAQASPHAINVSLGDNYYIFSYLGKLADSQRGLRGRGY